MFLNGHKLWMTHVLRDPQHGFFFNLPQAYLPPLTLMSTIDTGPAIAATKVAREKLEHRPDTPFWTLVEDWRLHICTRYPYDSPRTCFCVDRCLRIAQQMQHTMLCVCVYVVCV